MKIVINGCYGGFGISKKCAEFMAKKGNKRAIGELKVFEESPNKDKYGIGSGWYGYGHVKGMEGMGYSRTDPDLIEAVESLGKDADGHHAELKIVEIPDGIKWEIDEYDGIEHIAETHQTWG